ncbi:MAG: cytochrome c biogenesis protein CcdA [Candidatus Saccharimonadales bacterium]
MDLLLLSLLAGVLTVLSPCILPLLPVVLGGSLSQDSKHAPLVIIASSVISIIVFTLLLKGTSMFIGIPTSAWFVVSGIIIAIIGVTFIFPQIWEKIMQLSKLQSRVSTLSTKATTASGQKKNVILGLSLGPVFTSCSPTYGIVVATILPVNFALGTVYITAYALGLAAVLTIVAVGGQKVMRKLNWLSSSSFRKTLGVILLVTGLAIATGLIKELEIWLVETGVDLTRFEWQFINIGDI